MKEPTPPAKFLESLLKVITILEEVAKPGAEIFVVTVNQSSMSYRTLSGNDWRIPPFVDAYNDEIWSQVEVEYPITSSRSFRFKNFNRTFLLDSTDIMDSMWDSASDFYHPCRYAIRPIALRVLDLLKE